MNTTRPVLSILKNFETPEKKEAVLGFIKKNDYDSLFNYLTEVLEEYSKATKSRLHFAGAFQCEEIKNDLLRQENVKLSQNNASLNKIIAEKDLTIEKLRTEMFDFQKKVRREAYEDVKVAIEKSKQQAYEDGLKKVDAKLTEQENKHQADRKRLTAIIEKQKKENKDLIFAYDRLKKSRDCKEKELLNEITKNE